MRRRWRRRWRWRFGSSLLIGAWVLAAGQGARSAPRPLRLIGHWGEPTPIVRVVGDVSDPASEDHVSLGSQIWHAGVAPGGKFALLITDAEPWPNALLVLSLPDGQIVRALAAPSVRIEAQSFALAPDGRSALFAGDHHDVIIWDTERGRQLGRLVGPHDARVSAVAIAPDGRAALSGDEAGAVALWNLPDRKLRRRFSVEYGTQGLAFSPDGRRAVGVGRRVTIWDCASGKELLTLHGRGPFDRVAFTPDGNRLVLASAYRHVMTVSDTRTGRLLQLREKEPLPYEMAVAADGRSVLGQAQSSIQRWKLNDLGAVEELAGNASQPTGMGLGPGGRVFFTAGEDGDLRLWDAATGRRIKSRYARAVTALAWTPDGATLVAGAADGTLTVWSASGRLIRESTRHGNALNSIAISPDGKLAVSAAGDAALWPLPRGAERPVGGPDAIELAWATFSADGQRLFVGDSSGNASSVAVAAPGTLPAAACANAWSGQTAIPFRGGRALLGAVTEWGEIPDGHGDSDQRGATLARVDLETCKLLWSSGGPARTALALSPNETLALVADRKNALQLISMADGATVRSFAREGTAAAEDAGARFTTAIAFLSGGAQAMTGDSSGAITLWSVATGRATGQLTEPRRRHSYATSIVPRPRGGVVAVGTSRGEILLYGP